MKTKITQYVDTTIEISKQDMLELLRTKFPDIPNDAHISNVESDDGESVIGLEVQYRVKK